MKKTFKKRMKILIFFSILTFIISTITFAAMRYYIQEPEPPGTPHIINITNNSCTMEFTEPINDGGTPITHYIVEGRKEWHIRWKRLAVIDNTNDYIIKCKVQNLDYECSIKFHAIAANKVGLSKPSGDTEFYTIKDTQMPTPNNY